MSRRNSIRDGNRAKNGRLFRSSDEESSSQQMNSGSAPQSSESQARVVPEQSLQWNHPGQSSSQKGSWSRADAHVYMEKKPKRVLVQSQSGHRPFRVTSQNPATPATPLPLNERSESTPQPGHRPTRVRAPELAARAAPAPPFAGNDRYSASSFSQQNCFPLLETISPNMNHPSSFQYKKSSRPQSSSSTANRSQSTPYWARSLSSTSEFHSVYGSSSQQSQGMSRVSEPSWAYSQLIEALCSAYGSSSQQSQGMSRVSEPSWAYSQQSEATSSVYGTSSLQSQAMSRVSAPYSWADSQLSEAPRSATVYGSSLTAQETRVASLGSRVSTADELGETSLRRVSRLSTAEESGRVLRSSAARGGSRVSPTPHRRHPRSLSEGDSDQYATNYMMGELNRILESAPPPSHLPTRVTNPNPTVSASSQQLESTTQPVIERSESTPQPGHHPNRVRAPDPAARAGPPGWVGGAVAGIRVAEAVAHLVIASAGLFV